MNDDLYNYHIYLIPKGRTADDAIELNVSVMGADALGNVFETAVERNVTFAFNDRKDGGRTRYIIDPSEFSIIAVTLLE